jgi:hypothetical protein
VPVQRCLQSGVQGVIGLQGGTDACRCATALENLLAQLAQQGARLRG